MKVHNHGLESESIQLDCTIEDVILKRLGSLGDGE